MAAALMKQVLTLYLLIYIQAMLKYAGEAGKTGNDNTATLWQHLQAVFKCCLKVSVELHRRRVSGSDSKRTARRQRMRI